MSTYDVKCPKCGHKNRNLYLDETDGFMECEKCEAVVQARQFYKSIRLPVYDLDNFPKELLHPVAI